MPCRGTPIERLNHFPDLGFPALPGARHCYLSSGHPEDSGELPKFGGFLLLYYSYSGLCLQLDG